nr:DUF1540 domain-containing protein [Desulfitobacterium hafniense]
MDNKLKCDAVQCLHNMNHLCSAEKIDVKGGDTMGGRFTFCGTFHEKNVGNYVSELGNINLNGAVAQIFSRSQAMDPKVGCSAVNCIYNHDQICSAESLKIIN